jgi:hypothetical protein
LAPVVLALGACGAPPRIVSRPASISPGPSSIPYGNPVDVDALILEYPALEGCVFTAAAYQEHLPIHDAACDRPI